MRKSLGLALVMGITVLFSGCIISSSPDTDQVITMKPGDSMTFSMLFFGTPYCTYSIYLDTYEIELGGVQATLLWQPSFTYVPQKDDVGRHSIIMDQFDFLISNGMPSNVLYHGQRIWMVDVQGVKILPAEIGYVKPGENQVFTASVWPAGEYAYTWYLDDEPVGAGDTYTFAPTRAQIGSHILEVRASTGETTFTYTRQLTVPFAFAGGGGSDKASAIVNTPDGGYLVAGTSNSTDIPGVENHGKLDVYLVKFTAQGAIEWQKMYGGSSFEWEPTVLYPTADGGYIAACNSYSSDIPGLSINGPSDLYLIKLSAQGEIEWQRMYGGSGYEGPDAIQQTADGGYILGGGSTSSDIMGLTNHGGQDIYILKLDATGTVEWQQMLGGSDSDRLSVIRQTPDGGYIAAGGTRSPEINGMTKDSNSGENSYIVKLDAAGTVEWQKLLGCEINEWVNAGQPTQDGGYIFAGYYSYSDLTALPMYETVSDGFVLKLSGAGDIEWFRRYKGGDSDYLSAIQQTPDGGYIAAGSSYKGTGYAYSIDDKWENYVIKLDALGAVQWAKVFGQKSSDDNAIALCPTPEGGYMITGNGDTVTDIFLFRFAADGN